ncbi:MAG: hypothetical protein KJO07_18555 [Deltaproteobacteria bacterium]|nr:hypothetical protein [Deltaproteobacteria bacterium]
MRAARIAVMSLLLTALMSAAAPRARADFGLGLVLGEPTGLSAQYTFGERNALNFALGFEIIDEGDNDLYFHIDYIFMIADLVNTGAFDLPFYVGVGGFLIDRNDATIGARMPFGVEMQFKSAPINIFAEIGLSLAIIDDVDLDVFGALGFRYYF